ncbi:MAG TPA: HNH nuclease, partial [Mycobacterium sp.]|nr:HNH nuclease [Mycobacterium sp.]
MASSPAYLPPGVARERVREALDVIDAALARLRECSTDQVGTAFRVEVADRLETQQRLNRGLMYRVFGQIAEPP